MEHQNTSAVDTTQGPTLVNHAVKSGAIIGAISVVLTLLLYIANYALLADWKIGIGLIVIFIGAVIYAGISYRKDVGGFLPYGKAFQHGFIAFLVCGLVGTIFNILLYNVIDPALPQNITDASMEKMADMMRGFGVPEEQLDEQLEKMREEMPNNYSVAGLLKSFGVAIFIYALISLITALIVKKNQPETF